MILSEMAPGEHFVVSHVMIAGEIGKRLADMGFTEGVSGEMIRGAIMRGPMQVRIRGYDILIRRGEAACIEVKPEGDAQNDAHAQNDAQTISNDKDWRGPRPWLHHRQPAVSSKGPFGRGWRGFGRKMKSAFGEPDCCSGAHDAHGKAGHEEGTR